MKCQNLEEVRRHIDKIDHQIIQLIAERGNYVKQASAFKTNSQDVQAPQRVEAIIRKVRELATEYDANPNMIETLYREMIAGFINMEMQELSDR
jgi:isochorismate pyruvate lyase